MRKLAVNICATTGISLILLAVIGLLSGGTYLYLVGVFQVLTTNMMIHVGMLLVSRMALKYPLLEALVDIALILVMICGSGLAFGWFSSTPPSIHQLGPRYHPKNHAARPFDF